MEGPPVLKLRYSGLAVRLGTAALLALAGCSTYMGTTYKSFLRHVRANPDPNIRYLAYVRLGSPMLYDTPFEKAEVVDVLMAKLKEGREPLAIRAVIIRDLGLLGDRRARDAISATMNDPEGVIRVEACRALGRIGRPEDATTLARVMTVDNLEDCRIAAIEGLGTLKTQDPRIILMLLEGMEHDDPAIRLASLNALRDLTGKDLGVDVSAWRRLLEPQIKAALEPEPAGQPDSPAKIGPSRKTASR
jgi:HEAT repeat protein